MEQNCLKKEITAEHPDKLEHTTINWWDSEILDDRNNGKPISGASCMIKIGLLDLLWH